MNPKRVLSFVLALGLLLRLGWLWFFQGHFTAGDTARYLQMAQSLLQGEGYALGGELTAYNVPLYPMFLAFVFFMVGKNLLVVQLLQVVLSSLTVLLVYLLARQFFDVWSSIVAAILAALHPWLIFWNGYILTEPLFVFLFTASITSFVYLMANPSWQKALMTGSLVGVTTLCRSEALILLLWLLISWPFLFAKIDRYWAYLIVFFIAFSAILSPWIVRNFIVFQAFIPTATQIGGVLYEGNNPMVSQLGGGTGNVDYVWPKEIAEMDELQSSAYLRDLALQYIFEHPIKSIQNALTRLYLFWSPEFPTYSLKHKAFNYLVYVPLYVAALAGMFCLFSEKRRYVLLFVLVFVTITLVHIATVVDWDQRYRLPLQPLLIVLAGGGLFYLKGISKQKLMMVKAKK